MNDQQEKTPKIWVERTRLEEIMKRRDLNGKDLAEKWGKHPNSVYRLKKEGTVLMEDLATLCAVLECSPLDLLVWSGLPEHDPNLGAPVSH